MKETPPCKQPKSELAKNLDVLIPLIAVGCAKILAVLADLGQEIQMKNEKLANTKKPTNGQ